MMKIRDWFHKVSRRRALLRIDRLMGLSNMKLGKKTRKYFLRLRRSLNMKRRLLNLSDRIHNLGEFWDFDDFQTNYMMYINIIVIIGFIGFIIDPKFLSSIDTASIILTLALPIILFLVEFFFLLLQFHQMIMTGLPVIRADLPILEQLARS